MALYRSWLFAPLDAPARCRKALDSVADQVIWDLEDAVASDRKDAAREELWGLWRDLPPGGRIPWIRLNAVNSDVGQHDRENLKELLADARCHIMVPKADAKTVSSLVEWQDRQELRAEILLLVETAQGLWDLAHDGSFTRLQRARLAFGALDYQEDLVGTIGSEEEELLVPRTALVLRSRVLGWAAPIDAVYPAINDTTGLEVSALRAKRLGFSGKLVIHPKQVETVNRIFSPTPEERAWAEKVLQQAGGVGAGAALVDGEMVDRPVLVRAERIMRMIREENA